MKTRFTMETVNVRKNNYDYIIGNDNIGYFNFNERNYLISIFYRSDYNTSLILRKIDDSIIEFPNNICLYQYLVYYWKYIIIGHLHLCLNNQEYRIIIEDNCLNFKYDSMKITKMDMYEIKTNNTIYGHYPGSYNINVIFKESIIAIDNKKIDSTNLEFKDLNESMIILWDHNVYKITYYEEKEEETVLKIYECIKGCTSIYQIITAKKVYLINKTDTLGQIFNSIYVSLIADRKYDYNVCVYEFIEKHKYNWQNIQLEYYEKIINLELDFIVEPFEEKEVNEEIREEMKEEMKEGFREEIREEIKEGINRKCIFI